MLGSARSAFMKATIPTVVLPTPFAAYNFNEGSGLTAADASGNGRTLTMNTATFTTGHTSSGATNTGTGVGATVAMNGPTAAITMMGWVKPLALPAGADRLAFGIFDSGGNTEAAIFTERTSGNIGNPDVLKGHFRIGAQLIPIEGPSLVVGTWVHVAVTYDGSTLLMYVDGVQSDSDGRTGLVSTGDVFAVAGNDPNNSFGTDVVVDDVRIYSTALSAAEVSIAMNSPV
jgi:hypothetical protein